MAPRTQWVHGRLLLVVLVAMLVVAAALHMPCLQECVPDAAGFCSELDNPPATVNDYTTDTTRSFFVCLVAK